MFSPRKQPIAIALGALTLFLAACGGGGNSGGWIPPTGGGGTGGGGTTTPPPTHATNAKSLQAIVYGSADTGVPEGAGIPITMMGQMRALFDLIKKAPDFTQVVMDLGDGTPVHVLDTNTGDKFLPGKLALGLSYILIDMKAKNDPLYADYLATYQRVTTAMITQMSGANYLYANTSWGEYYYLVALTNLKARDARKAPHLLRYVRPGLKRQGRHLPCSRNADRRHDAQHRAELLRSLLRHCGIAAKARLGQPQLCVTN